MYALANNPQALKILLNDRTSGGSWVSMRFLSTYMTYKPAVAPEDFDICPILLTQPAEDRWTRLGENPGFRVSIRIGCLDRIVSIRSILSEQFLSLRGVSRLLNPY
jgi:hypothetical protein